MRSDAQLSKAKQSKAKEMAAKKERHMSTLLHSRFSACVFRFCGAAKRRTAKEAKQSKEAAVKNTKQRRSLLQSEASACKELGGSLCCSFASAKPMRRKQNKECKDEERKQSYFFPFLCSFASPCLLRIGFAEAKKRFSFDEKRRHRLRRSRCRSQSERAEASAKQRSGSASPKSEGAEQSKKEQNEGVKKQRRKKGCLFISSHASSLQSCSSLHKTKKF
uniref:Uncharacterized protein n=1 Tax=Hydrodictyon reticulatum TaxID=3107 RepID=A0A1W5RN32_HYDRE|nr:hypothetical protein [Hydrodictyon reticulatum]AQU64541.1 hypothetical protein [Hydrodictyon reticulatum]